MVSTENAKYLERNQTRINGETRHVLSYFSLNDTPRAPCALLGSGGFTRRDIQVVTALDKPAKPDLTVFAHLI